MVKVEIDSENSKVVMGNATTIEILSECASIVNCLWAALKNKDERLGDLFKGVVMDPELFSEESARLIEHHES